MIFVVDLKKFGATTQAQMRTVIRKVGIDVLTSVITKTPVDTGRARGNWQVSIGSYKKDVLEKTDPQGVEAISAGTSVVNEAKVGDKLYIVNNLPYIKRLENGYSKQAPQGMVALTLQEYENK